MASLERLRDGARTPLTCDDAIVAIPRHFCCAVLPFPDRVSLAFLAIV
jgi:hypothetical protein